MSRYQILGQIGQGGMGVVHRALDTELDRVVALKLLSGRFAEEEGAQERFQREIRVLAGLSHPNIVRVFDCGEFDGCPFYSMEIVEGGDLETRIRNGGALPLDETLRLLQQAAEALAYLHQRGLVHRDVKPANMMLDRTGVLKLTDFGLARTVTGTLITTEGQIIGTPRYMAPEVLRGHDAAAPQDVYALALSAHEILSGRPCFRGAKGPDLMAQILLE
ncbi:MAG: serine/threonine protein kinase, partial [Candidatus Riflebacteria bacterium]|nr:serine/threonine protein kinase [Candidatus Riflebacteria bacterium]